MASLEHRKLEESEVQVELEKIAGWDQVDGQIAKTFTFQSYKEGLVFAVAVGHLADRLNHHPEMAIGYRKVRVAMSTHDVGGLSPYDFALAGLVESL